MLTLLNSKTVFHYSSLVQRSLSGISTAHLDGLIYIRTTGVEICYQMFHYVTEQNNSTHKSTS